MLTVQAKGPESGVQYPCEKFATWYVLVMPALGRDGQMDFWGLLAIHLTYLANSRLVRDLDSNTKWKIPMKLC